MKLSTFSLALACASAASAASCAAGGVLGIGAGVQTLAQTFILQARAFNGTRLTVVNSPTLDDGFFFPLSLGTPNVSLDSSTTPIFTLQGGSAYAPGGTVLATREIPLLGPEPLYLSADGGKHLELFQAVNASCDGKDELVLRFTNLLPLPIASGITNGSFAPGAGLASPVLDNILTLGSPIDLIIVPHNSSS